MCPCVFENFIIMHIIPPCIQLERLKDNIHTQFISVTETIG